MNAMLPSRNPNYNIGNALEPVPVFFHQFRLKLYNLNDFSQSLNRIELNLWLVHCPAVKQLCTRFNHFRAERVSWIRVKIYGLSVQIFDKSGAWSVALH